jgi:hypothetical protein
MLPCKRFPKTAIGIRYGIVQGMTREPGMFLVNEDRLSNAGGIVDGKIIKIADLAFRHCLHLTPIECINFMASSAGFFALAKSSSLVTFCDIISSF